MSKALLGLLGLGVILVIITFAFMYRGRMATFPGIKELLVKSPEAPKVDKSDPEWLSKYCLEEVKNLPEAPFAYKEKDVKVNAYSSVSDVYLDKFIPEEKWFKAKTCAIWYNFENEEAYASVGVEYRFHIDFVNLFNENVDRLYTEAIDKSWKKISPLTDKEGGRPHYTYDGFPMIFTRENTELGTVEYATAEFGSRSLYIHFTVYEK